MFLKTCIWSIKTTLEIANCARGKQKVLRSSLESLFLVSHLLFVNFLIQYSLQLTDNFFSPDEFWSKSHKKLSKKQTDN